MHRAPRFPARPCLLLALAALLGPAVARAQPDTEDAMSDRPPENVYAGELIAYAGPYAFWLGKSAVIFVSDAELETLSADPDAVIDLSLTFDKHEDSLRGICEKAQAAGHRTLLISFDHFFKQYRPGQDTPRRLLPDMDEYIEHIARIARFAEGYGLGLELSLLSPLEIGAGYRERTGESGLWMHYRKGLRDPATGAYSVQLWRQREWVNNKGPIAVEDAGVRVFAFRERPVHGATYLAVDPNEIVEITETSSVEAWGGEISSGGACKPERIRVFGSGRAEVGPLDRVLVVQSYRTPEMDYFSESALPYLTGLADRYADAGVRFNGLYSDEMHIQQDWGYFNHHDNGEFCVRYVSDGLRDRFADAYGEEYRDFAKYLVYFCRGQEDARNDLNAKTGMQHVFGPTPEDVRRTALFRARYFRMLQDGVVDLFVSAKHHLERRMGHRLETRAHATWAESPTIDRWDTGVEHHARNQYEYTSNFVWSCTVHQAAAACHDYFKWGDYLTGTGNDHSEGGWLDRDYYGLALGCSTGVINETAYSYAAHWGSPAEVGARHGWLQAAFGTASSPMHGVVQDLQHRDVDVLMLYPLDLVAADERFGSWMVQYGYANYITTAKLLELGTVREGAIEMAGRRFTTLVALFEPNPPAELLTMMRDLVEGGGRVLWTGPPPLLVWDGADARGPWQDLFGADFAPTADYGVRAPGRVVEFTGPLSDVPAQTILTDLLPDRVYPVTPREGSETVASTQAGVVGVQRRVGQGSATFLGLRPRDDQSRSLGYDVRTLYATLATIGAYPETADGASDNTESLSRAGEFLACRFPNGAVSIAKHLREYAESWPGGFARRAEEDARYLADNPPPSPELTLSGYRVSGHTVDYDGHGVVTFRLDGEGSLIGFAGHQCTGVTVDGRRWDISPTRWNTIAWAPVPEARRVEGGAVMVVYAHGEGEARIPRAGLPASVRVYAEGATPGSRGAEAPSRLEGDALVITMTPEIQARWLYVTPSP